MTPFNATSDDCPIHTYTQPDCRYCWPVFRIHIEHSAFSENIDRVVERLKIDLSNLQARAEKMPTDDIFECEVNNGIVFAPLPPLPPPFQ